MKVPGSGRMANWSLNVILISRWLISTSAANNLNRIFSFSYTFWIKNKTNSFEFCFQALDSSTSDGGHTRGGHNLVHGSVEQLEFCWNSRKQVRLVLYLR